MANLNFLLDNLKINENDTLYDLLKSDPSLFKINVIANPLGEWTSYQPAIEVENIEEDTINETIAINWNYDYTQLKIETENTNMYSVYVTYIVLVSNQILPTEPVEHKYKINGTEVDGYTLSEISNSTAETDLEAIGLLNKWTETGIFTTVNILIDQHKEIKIDRERKIIFSTEDSNIIINRDNNSEEISFRMPRYYEGIDLSQKEIYIYFIRPDGESFQDSLLLEEINDEDILATWTITDIVTIQSGTMSFAIIARGNGYTDDYFWQTYPSQFIIDKGIFDNIKGGEEEFSIISPSDFQQQLIETLEKLNVAYERGEVKWQSLTKLLDELNIQSMD